MNHCDKCFWQTECTQLEAVVQRVLQESQAENGDNAFWLAHVPGMEQEVGWNSVI